MSGDLLESMHALLRENLATQQANHDYLLGRVRQLNDNQQHLSENGAALVTRMERLELAINGGEGEDGLKPRLSRLEGEWSRFLSMRPKGATPEQLATLEVQRSGYKRMALATVAAAVLAALATWGIPRAVAAMTPPAAMP